MEVTREYLEKTYPGLRWEYEETGYWNAMHTVFTSTGFRWVAYGG